MASRLAQCGILTCVVSYTLYPQAKARDMVAELSQALTWTLNNINTFGGDPKQACLLAYRASVISGVTRNLYLTPHAWTHGGEFERLLSSHLSILGRCAFLFFPLTLAGMKATGSRHRPLQVSALGHSAGAHMWAMVLIGRARAAREKPLHNKHAHTGKADDEQQDHRMPAQFIGGSRGLSSCALAAQAALVLNTPSDYAVCCAGW
jgi:hypothetical protein